MMDGILDAIGDIGFTVSVIAANLFILLYSTLARPWRTPSGRHIFLFMFVVALILDHAAIILSFPQYPGHPWVRAILYSALAVVMIWRILILVRVQVTARKKEQVKSG